MVLDAHGIIAAVEVAIYTPILIIGAILTFRHGFSRKAGWVFLVLLATIRIAGGITRILSEQDRTNKTLRVIYSILEAAGLSPLLSATLGFLGTVCQHSLDRDPRVTRGLRLLGLVGIVALVLGIVGGTNSANATSQDDLDGANTLRHVGIILFVVQYAGAAVATVFCWSQRELILKYRRQLLTGIAATLPFLFVRVLYGVLSTFAPSSIGFNEQGQLVAVKPSENGLGKFSSASSEWGIYLVMSVLMEYFAVAIYTAVGIMTPLSQDLPDYGRAENGWPKDPSSEGLGYR